MIKSSVILFLTCFFLYLPFSREPDYFDSETAPAIIISKGNEVVALYTEFGKSYALQLDKQAYGTRIGQKVEVIYALSHPEKAAIYKAWGYWFIGKEMAWAFGIFLVLLGIAYATTNEPHPDALAEQLNYKEETKTKYQ
ncbi:MAG: hypothetical protein RLZ95_1650 [Bacteroidota bacterium]|jgi:hypothetical protein